MVIEPKEITSNSQSGYLLNNYSVILRDNHHTDDVCLDHLNRMNKIELCINQNTASMIKNQWKNLDKHKQSESTEDFQKRKKAFAKYDKSAKEVISLLVQEGNEFYITHRYDKRGRTYASGYHCTYQGNAWNKAVIEFVGKETI
jgi:DNA-directed RNA polymerase